jgi:hypothetical protein
VIVFPGPAAMFDPALAEAMRWWLTAFYALSTALVLVVGFFFVRPLAVALRSRARQVRHRRRVARQAAPARVRHAVAGAHQRSTGGQATPPARVSGGVAPQAAVGRGDPDTLRPAAFHPVSA